MSSNAEVVLRTIQAVQDRDREALFSLYHEDVEFHEAESLPYGGVSRGRAALQAQLAAHPESTWLGTWGALQPTEAERDLSPRVIGENGNEVTVLYTMRAVSPSGERFERPVIALYEVRDGKFARAQMFHFDTAGILGFLKRASLPATAPTI